MPISGGDEEGYVELYILGSSIGLTAIGEDIRLKKIKLVSLKKKAICFNSDEGSILELRGRERVSCE